ncbi:MAG: ATP-binding protein [Crocosphaera sp.]|nr:ATP-binding protein [Crocosphaera sp.]
MDNLTHWQQHNQQYLAAALTWLRLRLLHGLASWTSRSGGGAIASGINESEVNQAAAAMAQAEKMEPPPALVILGKRLGLSRFEQNLLLLCAAMELDLDMIALCTQVQQQLGHLQGNPNFGLALRLFDEPAWDALSSERPLRYWQLLEINQPGAQPLIASALRADERIVNYLKGLNYPDDRLESFLIPLEVGSLPTELPPSQQTTVEAIVRCLQGTAQNQRPPVIQLLGTDSLSKQLVATQASAALGLNLYRLPVGHLPQQASELETLARLWQRESILLPIALYLDAQESEGKSPAEGQAPPLARFLARNTGLCFLSTRESRSHLGRPTIAFDIAKPTTAEQKAVWAEALGAAAPESPTRLAGQFNLNLPEIWEIAENSLAEGEGVGEKLPTRLWDACLRRTCPHLDTLAQRLEVKATWEDIVLPEKETNLLRQIAAQVKQRSQVYQHWGFDRKMNRGFGINALFAGDSGTGKTMAAEVIANDLHLNLYRIDLSAVVSKYIGETEKNLRRLFDAAEDGGAILFFDEADALFGKRSEVKDSHDRYANIEINYLLQRMEAYRGLAILATNLRSALDRAFLRRLRFLIDFPFPGAGERQRIWQGAFPPETPVEELDYERLSRFNLTGGSIHNIVLNAAFMGAAKGTPVTMPLVLNAIRIEFDKLERPINEAEFYEIHD